MDKLLSIAFMIGLLGLSGFILIKKVYPILQVPYHISALTVAGLILFLLVFTYYKLRD